MAKKIKQKSIRKNLISQIEVKLSESLMDLPKKYNEKKYKKILHKAGKIISYSIATKPVKAESKVSKKKSENKKEKIEAQSS